MATKKSTTKAKTNTTKSNSTKKTAAKTSAAKAKTAKTATKSVTKPAAAKAAPKVLHGITLLTLRRLHLFAVGVFVLLAALAGTMMNKQSYQLTVGHLTKDDVASTSQTVFAPAVHALYDIELRWLVVGILLLSVVFPLLYVTKMEGRYGERLRTSRMQPWRWADLGITCGLIVETLALVNGVHDLFVLKAVGGLILITSLLGLIAERQNSTSDKPVWSAFHISLFSGCLSWLIITAYMVTTLIFGTARSPWYVYALFAGVLVGVKLIALNQWKQYRNSGKWQDYMFVERNYILANIFTKAAFALILIAGVR